MNWTSFARSGVLLNCRDIGAGPTSRHSNAVVVDTNGIVSAAIAGGVPRALLRAATDGRFGLVVSPQLLDESPRCPAAQSSVLDQTGCADVHRALLNTSVTGPARSG